MTQPVPEAGCIELDVVERAVGRATQKRGQAARRILPPRIETQRVRQLLRGGIELAQGLQDDRQMKPMAGVATLGFDRPQEKLFGRVEIARVYRSRPTLGPGTSHGTCKLWPAMGRPRLP